VAFKETRQYGLFIRKKLMEIIPEKAPTLDLQKKKKTFKSTV
jgi:hypothetical protein